MFISFTSPHLWLLRCPGLLLSPYYVSLSTQTVQLPLYTPSHQSLTPPHTHFPLATPPRSLCLLKIYHRYSLWGWGGSDNKKRQNICGRQRAACRREFSPSTEGPRTAKQATLPMELSLFMFLCNFPSLSSTLPIKYLQFIPITTETISQGLQATGTFDKWSFLVLLLPFKSAFSKLILVFFFIYTNALTFLIWWFKALFMNKINPQRVNVSGCSMYFATINSFNPHPSVR